MYEVMLCPSRHRLLETKVSALRWEPLRQGRPVIVGTNKPHLGDEDSGAQYCMTVQPADFILLIRWVSVVQQMV